MPTLTDVPPLSAKLLAEIEEMWEIEIPPPPTPPPPVTSVMLSGMCGCPVCQAGKTVTTTFTALIEGRVPLTPARKVEMLPERMAAWVEALRSDRFRQNHGTWVDHRGRCAMAVLYSVAGIVLNGCPDSLQMSLAANWLGVNLRDFSALGNAVIQMNDRDLLPFSVIADRIEEGIMV